MFTYHYDTFIKRFRLYREKNFMASFVREADLLEFFPKAVKV